MRGLATLPDAQHDHVMNQDDLKNGKRTGREKPNSTTSLACRFSARSTDPIPEGLKTYYTKTPPSHRRGSNGRTPENGAGHGKTTQHRRFFHFPEMDFQHRSYRVHRRFSICAALFSPYSFGMALVVIDEACILACATGHFSIFFFFFFCFFFSFFFQGRSGLTHGTVSGVMGKVQGRSWFFMVSFFCLYTGPPSRLRNYFMPMKIGAADMAYPWYQTAFVMETHLYPWCQLARFLDWRRTIGGGPRTPR